MKTAMAEKYSVHLRHEQPLGLFRRQRAPEANGQTGSAQTIAASRLLTFTLDIQKATTVQLRDQAEKAALARNRDMAPKKPSNTDTPPMPRSPGEAAEMISEQGYWGVKKTAARLAEFVIRGAGDDLDRLRAGRAGIIKGFKEAEAIWGATLPSISHQTLETALTAIDSRIRSLDSTVVNVAA